MSGELAGIATAVLLVAFVGVVIWAWSRRRSEDFARAAMLPLEEDRITRNNRAKEQAP
jgi:cytochrome c oxidase cbb3-type subunit IV